MKRQLKVRVQKLTKKLPQEASEISAAIYLKPEEEEVFEKKGTIYTTFDVTCSNLIDPLLVKKIVKDVLANSYYNSESASPIQALERAVVDVKGKITDLPGVNKSEANAKDFNILVAAFWGNVLYIVQFGKGGSFLVRNNDVKPISSATEGKFSVASGVVKNDDVIFLGTQSFVDKNNVEDLIGGKISVSTRNLANTASAILLKFELETELTQEDKIDFGINSEKNQKHSSRPLKSKPSPSTIDLAKGVPSKLPKISVQSIKQNKFPFKTITLFVSVVSLGVFGFLNKNKIGTWFSKSEDVKSENQEIAVEQEQEEEQGPSDEELKIERINPDVFYDLKIVDEQASPTDIVVLDSEVIVSDRALGKLFVSSSTTPGFEEEAQFGGIRSLSYFGGDLTFVDDEGYTVYEKPVGEEGLVTGTYEGENISISKPYLTFLYSIKGAELVKYQLLDTGLDGSTWAQSSDFEGVVSMAIDGNIYILKSNELLRYFSGQKEDFELSGLNTSLSNAVKVVKSFDFDNIYIADSGNNRVLVFDEDGVLQKQFIAEEEKFNDIKSISVSPTEETLFVLSGSKVFEIDLIE